MRRHLVWIATALFVSAGTAQACGPKCKVHRRHYRAAAPCVVYSHPAPLTYGYVSVPSSVLAYPPTAAPTQASPASASMVVAAPPAVAPTYEYPTQPTAGGAYYYTYDDSGKLIIQQWGDWLFRGGKEAGMPRPPLPIVGYLQRR